MTELQRRVRDEIGELGELMGFDFSAGSPTGETRELVLWMVANAGLLAFEVGRVRAGAEFTLLAFLLCEEERLARAHPRTALSKEYLDRERAWHAALDSPVDGSALSAALNPEGNLGSRPVVAPRTGPKG